MKNWYVSKTIWLAVIQLVIAVVAAFSGANPEITWALTVKSGLDIILRLATTQSII